MKMTSATYEHSTLGFPKIVLKWYVENGEMSGKGRLVIKGIIAHEWTWQNLYPLPFIDAEMKRFDDWVRAIYSNDASVQG